MPKYGRGLKKEIIAVAESGELPTRFNTRDVIALTKKRGGSVPRKYLAVILPNAATDQHSHTYGQVFKPLGNGYYQLLDLPDSMDSQSASRENFAHLHHSRMILSKLHVELPQELM